MPQALLQPTSTGKFRACTLGTKYDLLGAFDQISNVVKVKKNHPFVIE